MFRIAFLGDIVGKPGRLAAKRAIKRLEAEYQPHCIIANGENAAHGKGITIGTAAELFGAGIDILTGGNHIWDKKDIYELLEYEKRIIRPLNYPVETPGQGTYIISVGNPPVRMKVINALGRAFMEPVCCPFRAVERELDADEEDGLVVIDFHAEATSEKLAFGHYFDGKVTAVIGTHTHVPTADATILEQGTAYITDVGMCGAAQSILGVRSDQVIQKFLTSLPVRFEVETEGPVVAAGVVVDCDTVTHKAVSIEQFIWYFD